jgi:tyrosine aminotransferase
LEIAKEAVAERYTHPNAPLAPKDVIITSGCSGALEMVFSALAHPGQTILLPQPGFSLYRTICDNKGISVKYYHLLPDQNWEADLSHVESLLDETVVGWLINNPSNPCGSVYSRDHLQQCKSLAKRHHLTIISDEIYEDMVFPPNEFHPLASLEPSIPLLTCGGMAKRFLVPGWRLGWILIHDQSHALDEIRNALVDLAGIILGANSLIQAALPSIFSNVTPDQHAQVNNYVANNARIAYEALYATPGLKLFKPQGAFYMMVGLDMSHFDLHDDIEVCERLIAEESVVCLPGVIFGMPNYIRLVYCAPPELIGEAANRIKAFCARHYQSK